MVAKSKSLPYNKHPLGLSFQIVIELKDEKYKHIQKVNEGTKQICSGIH